MRCECLRVDLSWRTLRFDEQPHASQRMAVVVINTMGRATLSLRINAHKQRASESSENVHSAGEEVSGLRWQL